jgi:8-oxo-dGTP diphosphatase
MRPRSAVCLVIPSPTNATQFLAISRRKDFTKWGLPGGKVDPGESCLQAALRECQEEVSLKLNPELMIPVYSGGCPGKGPDDTYWVTTYLCLERLDLGALAPESNDFALDWQSWADLTDPSRSPFAGYNREVEKAIAAYTQLYYEKESL